MPTQEVLSQLWIVPKKSYGGINMAFFFTGFEKQIVKKRRLDSIFNEFNIREIDILSLDIEGYEVEAIKGIDFTRYKPKVMVIESDKIEHSKQLDSILAKYGYFKILKISSKIFYTFDRKISSRLKNKYLNIKLIHTAHPLDGDVDNIHTVSIKTKRNFMLQQEMIIILKKILKLIKLSL